MESLQVNHTSTHFLMSPSDPTTKDELGSNGYTTAARRKCSIVSTSSWACDEVLLCPWGWCLRDFFNPTAYPSKPIKRWQQSRLAWRVMSCTMWFTKSALTQRTTRKFTSGIDHGSKRKGGPLSHRCFTVTFIPALTDRNGASTRFDRDNRWIIKQRQGQATSFWSTSAVNDHIEGIYLSQYKKHSKENPSHF